MKNRMRVDPELSPPSVSEVIRDLRFVCVETGSLACFGCGHEHNCGTRGCAIIRNGIECILRLNNFDQAQSMKLLARCGNLEGEIEAVRQSSVSHEAHALLIAEKGGRIAELERDNAAMKREWHDAHAELKTARIENERLERELAAVKAERDF